MTKKDSLVMWLAGVSLIAGDPKRGKPMTYDECANLLASIKGCTFAALDTVTTPILKGGKSNPMQGKVEKHCTGHRVLLFTNKNSSGYENKVRRHLEREGKNPDSFVMGGLPWGERIKDTPFIHNKGKHYLQCVFLASGEVTYRYKESGETILKEEIIGLNERSGSEHQNLDDQVIVRTYAIESIVALRAFHEELT